MLRAVVTATFISKSTILPSQVFGLFSNPNDKVLFFYLFQEVDFRGCVSETGVLISSVTLLSAAIVSAEDWLWFLLGCFTILVDSLGNKLIYFIASIELLSIVSGCT